MINDIDFYNFHVVPSNAIIIECLIAPQTDDIKAKSLLV